VVLLAALAGCQGGSPGGAGGGTGGSGGGGSGPSSGGAGGGGSGGASTGGQSGAAGTGAPGSGGAGGTANTAGTGGGGTTTAADASGAGGGGGSGAPGGRTVTVTAGMFDRDRTPVAIALGSESAGKLLALRDASGARLPLQVDADGRAVFVLPALKAGASASFTLDGPQEAPAGVEARKGEDHVEVAIGSAVLFRYQMQGKLPAGVGQNFLRGGYVHPLYTPTGVLVTDDYPGDHRHHHGIWSAWAHTTFAGREIDFWNMGGGSAKVDFDALVGTWNGPVHGGLKTKQVHVSLAGGQRQTALNELWVLTAYRTHDAAAPYALFDLDSTQEAASATPVMLDQYIYGGLGLRGNRQWASGAQFLTSEGRTRANGDGSNARWTHMGGMVDGKPAGYAVLCHPDNFRAPQPVRLNPSDPFYSIAPVRPSGFTIMQGKPYVSRYRVVVSDGAADKALLDRLWNDYASPPEAKLEP
jgi:Methane oxygenase PmoA